MSKKAVYQLIEAAEQDNSLKQKLYQSQEPQTILAIASARGYEFSEAELIAVMQDRRLSFELSDEQLETVVGGKNTEDKDNSDNTYSKFTSGKITFKQ